MGFVWIEYIFIQFIYVDRDVYDSGWRYDKQHRLGAEVRSHNSKTKDNMEMKKSMVTH